MEKSFELKGTFFSKFPRTFGSAIRKQSRRHRMGQLHIRIQSSLLPEISVLFMSVLTSEMLGTERVSASAWRNSSVSKVLLT